MFSLSRKIGLKPLKMKEYSVVTLSSWLEIIRSRFKEKTKLHGTLSDTQKL
jgi:hypothetical protein